MLATAEARTGFIRTEFDTEGAERLVLRFAQADVSAGPAEGTLLRLELQLAGPPEAMPGWQPLLRRLEGILVLAEGEGPVRVAEARVRVPLGLQDVEIHSRGGDIEVRGLSAGLVIETDSGSVLVIEGGAVEAISTTGSIAIETAGPAELRTVSGSIRIVESRDRVKVRSQSGDIDAEGLGGDFFAETGTGEVSVRHPTGRVMVQTQSGDIEVEAGAPFGGGDIESASGAISLDFKGSALELRAETLSGRLSTPHGEVNNQAGPRRAALTVGPGGRRLHAKSVEGDIDIDF
jgi:DUF4097 and DUF4098 domain-containing protein YvlB